MKKRILKTLVCMMLIVTMLAACMPSAMAASKTYILKVNASGVRLHYNTNGGGENTMITSLKSGTRVLFLSMPNKSWCKVRTEAGLVGYIYKDYLTKVETVTKSSCYSVAVSHLIRYKIAGRTMKKINRTIAGGTTVIVTATKSGYAQIETLGGTVMYVKLEGLKKLF